MAIYIHIWPCMAIWSFPWPFDSGKISMYQNIQFWATKGKTRVWAILGQRLTVNCFDP